MSGHVPRRLRKQPGPKWALVTKVPVSAEQAAAVKAQWRAAMRKPGAIVIDGTTFDVRRLR